MSNRQILNQITLLVYLQKINQSNFKGDEMKKILSLFLILAFATSCASSTKRELEAEKQAIGEVRTEAEVIAKATSIFEKSSLSKDKKEAFVKIYKKHRKELEVITRKIKKHRVLLVKTMTSKKFSHKKFNRVKKHLKQLVDERFEVYINQFVEAKKVIGVDMKNVYDDPWFELQHRF